MSVVNLPLPRLGETMDEGRIVAWMKQPGDAFKRGDILLEVETDKTVVEVPALQDGVMVEHLAAEAEMIPVDTPIARIDVVGAKIAPAAATAASQPKAAATQRRQAALPVSTGDDLRASPRARRLARDHRIPLSGIRA